MAKKEGGRSRKTVASKGKKSKKTTTTKKKHDRGNVYLGKTVRDVGKPGLDHLSEVEGICKAIIRDYKNGKISKKTANGRFSLLYNFVIPRTKMTAKQKKEARQIVRAYWNYFSTQVEQRKRSKNSGKSKKIRGGKTA